MRTYCDNCNPLIIGKYHPQFKRNEGKNSSYVRPSSKLIPFSRCGNFKIGRQTDSSASFALFVTICLPFPLIRLNVRLRVGQQSRSFHTASEMVTCQGLIVLTLIKF